MAFTNEKNKTLFFQEVGRANTHNDNNLKVNIEAVDMLIWQHLSLFKTYTNKQMSKVK